MTFSATFLLLTVLSLLAFGEAMRPRTLSFTGKGTITARPDLSIIETGVVTEDKVARVALTENNKAFSRLLNVLDKAGIPDRDIQTSNFNIAEQFERLRFGRKGNFTGYRVTNEVEVQLRNTTEVSGILDSLVSAGSNSVRRVSFTIEDPAPVLDQARMAAVQDVLKIASLYADTSGVKLGDITSIVEQSINRPRAQGADFGGFGSRGGRAAEGLVVGIAPGEIDTSARVSMVFELQD